MAVLARPVDLCRITKTMNGNSPAMCSCVRKKHYYEEQEISSLGANP
jgi:hypothetical protein